MKTGRIPIGELAHLPIRALVTTSHDGQKAAYFSNITGRIELYEMDLATRRETQITHGEAPRTIRANFVWSRDNESIIFVRDVRGDEQNNLFSVNLATHEVTQLNDDPTTQEYVVDVFHDGRSLLVQSNRNGQVNLFCFDQESREWTQLTRGESPVHSAIISPDGTQIAYSTNESLNLQNSDGYIMNIDGSDQRRIFRVEEGSSDGIVGWHPGGDALLVGSDASGSDRLGLVTLKDGAIRWLSPESVDVAGAEFSHRGDWIVALENFESQIRPVLYAYPSGERREVNLPAGVASQAAFVLDDQKLLVYYSSASRRGEMLLYDLATDEAEVLMPAEYGSIDPNVFVGNQHVTYRSTDGGVVPAILYRPDGIPEGAKLPAVIDVHGGPTGQYFRSFNAYAQLLVDQGYVVLQPNFRGSTGYGRAWREGNLMDWGGGDLEDVASGVEYLKQLGCVDSDRVAIFGGSYGGYMSYMAAVKKPDLFKVSVPVVGITDLLLLYEEDMAHFKYYLRSLMGDPEENRELWQERSAINYVDQLKGKMLIIHGLNDPRCPIRQARNFRDKLLEHGYKEGQDFEYVEWDEGHGAGGDPAGTERMFHTTIDFLRRAL